MIYCCCFALIDSTFFHIDCRDHKRWTYISNSIKPTELFGVFDLDPASWYQIRIAAQNSAGWTEIEYEFATLTQNGVTIAPPLSQGSDKKAVSWSSLSSTSYSRDDLNEHSPS